MKGSVGHWGMGILDNDTSADVRERYREHLGDGLDDADAARRVLEEFSDDLATDETGEFRVRRELLEDLVDPDDD